MHYCNILIITTTSCSISNDFSKVRSQLGAEQQTATDCCKLLSLALSICQTCVSAAVITGGQSDYEFVYRRITIFLIKI